MRRHFVDTPILRLLASGLCYLLPAILLFSPADRLEAQDEIPAFGDFEMPAAPSFETAHTLYLSGEYEAALELASQGRFAEGADERWWRLEGEILLILGRYEDAYARMSSGVVDVPDSLWIMLLRREAGRYVAQNDSPGLTQQDIIRAINYAAAYRGRESTTSPDFQAAVGQAALVAQVEPKLVLDNFLKPAQAGEPASRDAFLISGQLALDKHDPALASRTFRAGLEKFPDDPDLLAGYAASFRNGDRTQMLALARQALELNPRHIRAHLLLADHLLDAEDYDGGRSEIDSVLAINPRHPEAHAYLAVIAELENNTFDAIAHRTEALATWGDNPLVDHLIGLKLSQRYRFKEGSSAQRRSLAADPGFVPAQVQLAQDMLRLGDETAGWELAAHAHATDGYNIDAFNLTTLHDRVGGFATVESPHFRIRMSPEEAEIYGDRALALLEEARGLLTERYGFELEERTTVEIYPDPKDFGVRTFGIPGVGGYLGVCFGSVFTVNSPASSRANWEAVLWHEFAHVITLTMSRNRMPRWLSEGISVYEELERNPAWGQRMSIDYAQRILSGRTQPISRMSAAFLEAEDQEGTLFAYYQSYLVVDFLINTYGFEPLKNLLRDLGRDRDINDSLAHHFAPLDELDPAFATYATNLAESLAPGYELGSGQEEEGGMLTQLLNGPRLPFQDKHLPQEMVVIRQLIENEAWEDARDKLTPLIESGIYLPGQENFHRDYVRVCRELDDLEAEKQTLLTIAAHEADSISTFNRLLTLAREDEDWAGVARWSDAWLAVNPLAATPWRARFNAHIELEEPLIAVTAGRTLLNLDPPDRAAVNHSLAGILEHDDPAAARRHVLQALEEAPRFRSAYELLNRLPDLSTSAPTP